MVFCCNSRRNHAYWQNKTSEDLVVMRRCVVRRLIRRSLFSHVIVVFVWFLLKDQLQSFTNSIGDLVINVAETKT